MNKTHFFCIGFMLLILGCTPKNPQKTDGIKIASLFYPQYIMLINITQGTNAQISLVAPPETGCLHDYVFTVQDMQTILNADAVVVNGAGMETHEFDESKKIDASVDFALIDQNPHIWVSPKGAAYQTTQIAQKLAAIDKKNAARYLENAQKYCESLLTLDYFMHSELNDFEGQNIIAFESFVYFAHEFGLHMLLSIQEETDTQPNPKELVAAAKVIKNVQKNGIHPAFFADSQYPAQAAQIVANETGLKVYEFDSCVSGSLTANAYIEAMKKNTQVVKNALKLSKKVSLELIKNE